MKQQKAWGFLTLFGEESGGEAREQSTVTPSTSGERSPTGEVKESASVAGETSTVKTRREEFRSLMEGEYKDLFTEYFQETFNRRFREQKGMIEELERLRAVERAVTAHFGVREGDDLLTVIRTEYEKKIASAEAERSNAQQAEEQVAARIRHAVREAVESTRAETEEALLAHIRARGLRPAESALSAGGVLRGGSTHLSRAQRAEVARRAARGEHIEL